MTPVRWASAASLPPNASASKDYPTVTLADVEELMSTERCCNWCGTPLSRRTYRSGKPEDWSYFAKRKFCDMRCYSAMRNAAVPPTVDAGRKRAQRRYRSSQCTDCGSTKKRIDRHHIDGNPPNNAPENIAPLCSSCHATRHWREGSQDARVARQTIAHRDPQTGRISSPA